MTDPTIKIALEENSQQCQSCKARNCQYAPGIMTPRPADVEDLFELTIGSSVTVLCAPCLQALTQVIHPHRTGT